MRSRITLLAAILIVLAALGCDDTGENARIVTVTSLFNEGAPVVSDVLEQGDDISITSDDFIADDVVPIEFYAKPYADLVVTAPGKPYGDVIVERYDITYTRVDGGTEVPPPFTGALCCPGQSRRQSRGLRRSNSRSLQNASVDRVASRPICGWFWRCGTYAGPLHVPRS